MQWAMCRIIGSTVGCSRHSCDPLHRCVYMYHRYFGEPTLQWFAVGRRVHSIADAHNKKSFFCFHDMHVSVSRPPLIGASATAHYPLPAQEISDDDAPYQTKWTL